MIEDSVTPAGDGIEYSIADTAPSQPQTVVQPTTDPLTAEHPSSEVEIEAEAETGAEVETDAAKTDSDAATGSKNEHAVNTTPFLPQTLSLSPEDKVARLAEVLGLTSQGNEYHGPNPFDAEGATEDGFFIRRDGSAYDRKLERSYSRREVEELSQRFVTPDPRYVERASSQDQRLNPQQPNPQPNQQSFDWTVARIAPYVDVSEILLYQVGRIDFSNGTKQFRQRRPGGNGKWLNNLTGVQLVLYNLPRVCQRETVIFVEGEKAADVVNAALEAAGLSETIVATTTAMGAGNSHKTDVTPAYGKDVFILPDNDRPGVRYAADLRGRLKRHSRVRVVKLPDLDVGEDIVDFLAKGHTIAEVLELMEAAPVAEPPDEAASGGFPDLSANQIPEAEHTPRGPSYSDRQIAKLTYPQSNLASLASHAANAERIYLHYGNDLCHVAGLGWLWWNSKFWESDDQHSLRTIAHVTKLSSYVAGEAHHLRQLAELLEEDGRKDDAAAMAKAALQLEKFSKQLEDGRFARESLLLAAGNPKLNVPIERFEPRPWVIGFQNGVWDRGLWRQHRRDDHLRYLSPVHLDEQIDQSEFFALLDRMTGGDREFQRYLQEVAGYIFSGASHLRIILWLYGPKGTGKSTFTELLQTVLGKMSTTLEPKKLGADSQRERLGAILFNKLLAVCQEAGNMRTENEVLKMLSGGDTFPARFLYKEAFDVRPHHVLVMVSNHAPRLDVSDDALKDRIMTLPFHHALNEGGQLVLTSGARLETVRKDPTAPLVLGFARWAMEGCKRVYETNGISSCAAVEEATRQFWLDTDPLTEFWEGIPLFWLLKGIERADLHIEYEHWCLQNGVRLFSPHAWVKACEGIGLYRKNVGKEKTRFWFLAPRNAREVQFVQELATQQKPKKKPQALVTPTTGHSAALPVPAEDSDLLEQNILGTGLSAWRYTSPTLFKATSLVIDNSDFNYDDHVGNKA
jgi:putative DNA primase/helicase